MFNPNLVRILHHEFDFDFEYDGHKGNMLFDINSLKMFIPFNNVIIKKVLMLKITVNKTTTTTNT